MFDIKMLKGHFTKIITYTTLMWCYQCQLSVSASNRVV